MPQILVLPIFFYDVMFQNNIQNTDIDREKIVISLQKKYFLSKNVVILAYNDVSVSAALH